MIVLQTCVKLIRRGLVFRRYSRLTHDYSASQLPAARVYLKCGLTPLAALGSYNSINILHRTIFGRGGPILATKFGPPGPILVDQKWSVRTVFFPDQNFRYSAQCALVFEEFLFSDISKRAFSTKINS